MASTSFGLARRDSEPAGGAETFVRIPLTLGYDAVARLALDYLREHPVEVRRRGVEAVVAVTDLALAAQGDALVGRVALDVDMRPGFLGTRAAATLRGRPVVTADAAFRVTDASLEFDRVSNPLVRAGLRLFQGAIAGALQRALAVDLNPRLSRLLDEANARLGGRSLADGVRLDGALTALRIESARVEPHALALLLEARGTLGVVVADLVVADGARDEAASTTDGPVDGAPRDGDASEAREPAPSPG